MIKNIDIVGIGGSQEENSFSLQILKYTLNEVTLLGARTKLIDIKSLNLPIYDYSGGKLQPQAGLKKIMDDIHKSHGIIFTSPEYHGTVSASFKNFIDYLEFLYSYDPPYLTNKPVGCISIAGGDNSGVNTLNTLVNIVHSLRGITVSSNFSVSNIKNSFNSAGKLIDEAVIRRIKRLSSDIYFVSSKLSL